MTLVDTGGVDFSVKKLSASRKHTDISGEKNRSSSSVTLMKAEGVFCQQNADQPVLFSCIRSSVESLSPLNTCLCLSVESTLTQRCQVERWLWTRAAVSHKQGLERHLPLFIQSQCTVQSHHSLCGLTLTVPWTDSYIDRE